MKKIIFIELLHHHECLENPYLKYKKEGYETKAILGEFVNNQLTNINKFSDEFFILKQPVRKLFPKKGFVKKIKYVFNEFIEIYKNTKELKKIITNEKPDIIYINTIESPFLVPLMIYLLKINGIKIYLTMHNTNRLKISIRKYILFDFLIKKLINKSDKIILLGEYLKFEDKNIQNKVEYSNNRIIKEKINKKFDKKTFVMSGSLDIKNKDYESILKGISKFLNENTEYKSDFELVLLGQLNEIVEKWINFYKLSEYVKTFDAYVGENDMNKYMSGAHYAIISTFKGSIYGKYKISGAYGDATGYNVPILLSENYAPGFQSDKVIRFNNNEFDKLLTKIYKGK